MKTILLLLCMLLPISMMGQEAKDFARMKKAEREAYMINLAMEVAQNFGPDYCREPLKARVLGMEAFEGKQNLNPKVSQNHGRRYYTVELRYANRQVPDYVYASKVKIWVDTGEPAGVLFGNGRGVLFTETSYKDWLKRGIKEEELAKYRRPDFEFYESLSAKELKEMNQAVTDDKHRRERERMWRKVKEEKSKEQVKEGDIVHGKVTDDKGEPLMKVNVIEIDKEKRIIGHAVTDVNGSYSLKIINPKDTLMASYFAQDLETNIIRHGAKRTLITGHSIDIVIEVKRSDEQPKPKLKASSATSDPMGDDWETYVRKNKEYWGVSISFPHHVKIESEENVPLSKMRVFQFASMRQSGGNIPIFEAGPIITLDDNCVLLMSSVRFASKPKPDHEVPIDENTISRHGASFTSELLNNCGLPWFHIDHEPSVLNDKELMEKINATKQKYIRMHANDRLTQITNSDKVFITQIPNMKKVKCEVGSVTRQVKKNATDCYGLEFYRADRYHAVEMLLFINSKGGKSIDDYVEQISGYINFDKNFKY